MRILRVTTLTKRRGAHAEHSGIVRAVWVVAVAAVLGDRRVFPQVGATCFRMAVVAGVVGRRPGEQAVSRLAVCVVTTAAIHLALPDRMRIRFHRLRALLLMAVETHVGLRRRGQHWIAFNVAGVAISTGDGVGIMSAAVPGKARLRQVAIHAVGVLFGDWRSGVGSEYHNRWTFLAATNASGMITAGAVAGFALQLTVTERGVGITGDSVLGAKDCQGCLIVVALEAGVSAFLAVLRWLDSLVGALCRNGGWRRDGRKGHREQRQTVSPAGGFRSPRH